MEKTSNFSTKIWNKCWESFYSKEEPKVVALVYYNEGIDAKEANEKYMKSKELKDDMEGFDLKKIIKADELFLWQ